MTHPDPKVQVLLTAIDRLEKDTIGVPCLLSNVYRLAKALRPEPEMETVLPKYGRDMPPKINEWLSYHTVSASEWEKLITLTMRPVQKQKLKLFEELSADNKAKWNTFAQWNTFTRWNEVPTYNNIILQLRRMEAETP